MPAICNEHFLAPLRVINQNARGLPSEAFTYFYASNRSSLDVAYVISLPNDHVSTVYCNFPRINIFNLMGNRLI